MNLYFYTYMWALTSNQIALFALISLVSAAPRHRAGAAGLDRDKRNATMALFLAGVALSSGPSCLRLLGLFLPNGLRLCSRSWC